MTRPHRRAIAWFRRDLRLRDNRMVEAATAEAGEVVPFFVADAELLARHATAPARVAWFAEALRELDAQLSAIGSGLTVLVGDPAAEVARLAERIGAEAVYAGRDEEPAAVARDAAVGASVELHLVDDQRLLPPDALRTGDGAPYRRFGPFRRALDERLADGADRLVAEAQPDLSRLAPAPAGARGPEAFPRPAAPLGLPPAGEEAAATTLEEFADHRLRGYRAQRDRPDLDATSRISPHLRVGTISVRAAWRAAVDAERRGRERGDGDLQQSARRWRDELAWREFFAAVLHASPRVTEEAFRTELGDIGWESGSRADESLEAWTSGMTGFPFVDAGMRQLAATGWMHNRLRLVTASFLVKDLGIDWRRGEAVFMRHLLDGDVAQNAGNWRWVAGVGTDAAPYFRILNPVLQGRRFDPRGAFVRRWVPELASLPDELVHEPWLAPRGQRPGAYPPPMVDHAEARQRALDRYAAARKR